MRAAIPRVPGADSVVVLDNQILEKPDSDAEAVSMITRLSGNRHTVATGVALVFRDEAGATSHVTFVEETSVKFAPLSDEEVRAYIACNDHSDKAGGYGLVCSADGL